MACESCSSNFFDNEINNADRTIWQLRLYHNGVFLGKGWVGLIFLSACKLFPAVLLLYFHVEKKLVKNSQETLRISKK